MGALKTVNVLIVAVAAFLAVVAIAVAILVGTDVANQEQTKQVRACVAAGNQWVAGNCVHTKP